MAVLVQIDAWDPVAGLPATIQAASHDDPAVCHLNGQTWWPALAQLPKLQLDLFDGAFGDQITAPSSSLTMAIEPWPNFARYSLADGRFRLWTGAPGAPWSEWTLRFDGRVSEQPPIANGIASVSFAVDDRWMDTPLLALYAGTTGADGEAAQKGSPKPLSIGAPRYAPGVMIDSIDTILQLSAYGPIEAVDAAMEKLSRFGAPAGDYPSFAALKAAYIPAGAWATALAGGYVRHGAPLTGQSSYLLRGDAVGGRARLPGAVIRRIAEIAGAVDKVSLSSLSALDAARPWPISLWLADQITPRAIIQRIAASVNAVAGVSWLGKLFVVPIGIGAPSMTLRSDGSALPPVGDVSQVTAGQPFWRLALQAERTWQVHAFGDVAFTATLVDMGEYDAATIYREGNIIRANGSSWLYTNPTPSAGNPPPTLPVETNAWWAVLAKAGADGRSGYDGLPGAPGADGRTTYTHYAYANSSDGYVDFDTGAPNGRAYEGSYTDFTAADSPDRNAYTWREYKGPPFGMAAGGYATVAGNSVIKRLDDPEGMAWNSGAYSTVGYRGGCTLSFTGSPDYMMGGLNTDPTTDNSYGGLDYAWYLQGDGSALIYESGTPATAPLVTGGFAGGVFQIDYDGKFVRYYYNGALKREVAAPANLLLYFDSSINTPGGRINNLAFTPRGEAGEVGSGSWTHIANSASTIVTPTSARGTASTGWGADGSQSKESYARGAAVDFVLPPAAGRNVMAGLTTHPASSLSYDRISFAIFREETGSMNIFVDGNNYSGVSAPPADQPVACRVEFDGVDTVRWYVAGTLRTTMAWPYPDIPLFFACALASNDPRVENIAFSSVGARGRNGSDGAPGAPGADGRTAYVHYAYANSPDGNVDFAVGAPNGRAFQGVYSDFTAADSTNPASYTWSAYKGPASFGLAARGDVILASNALVKVGTGTWGAGGGYSTEGWKGGAQTSFKLATTDTFAGLNTDPTSDDSYGSVDYAWHCSGDGNTYIFESGSNVLQLPGGNDGNRTFQIVYDNSHVRYYVNGALVRDIAVAAGLTLYFDAAIAGLYGAKITDISFLAAAAAGTPGSPGLPGAPGSPGSPGAPGDTPTTWDLGTYSVSVTATSAGVTNPGQLPKNVTVKVSKGTTDVTGAATIGVAATAGISATYASGVVSINQIDADGKVTVTATSGGVALAAKTIDVSRSRDPAPPASSTSLSRTDYFDVSSASYGSADTGVISLQSNASGQLNYTYFDQYVISQPQTNPKRTCTLASRVMFRQTNTSAWSYSSEVVGSQAVQSGRVQDDGDEGPGQVGTINTITGLAANTYYDVSVSTRRYSGTTGATGYGAMTLTIRQ